MCPRSSGEYFIRGNLFLEFPLERMAFCGEAAHPDFFEDPDGADVVITALRSDHLDTRRLKSPVDHPTRHLGGIALPFIGRNDIVANLHPACHVRRAVEPDATDRYLVSLMENNAIPDQTQRILLHGLDKQGERFQQVDFWPDIRNRDPEHLSQSGSLRERDLLECQRVREQLEPVRFQSLHEMSSLPRFLLFTSFFRLRWEQRTPPTQEQALMQRPRATGLPGCDAVHGASPWQAPGPWCA